MMYLLNKNQLVPIKNVNSIYSEIMKDLDVTNEYDREVKNVLVQNREEAKKIITRLCSSSKTAVGHVLLNQRYEPSVRESYASWGKFIAGEITSLNNQGLETKIAKNVIEDSKNLSLLRSFCAKIYVFLNQESPDYLKNNKEQYSGTYVPYMFPFRVADILKNPNSYSFSSCISAIHDVQEYLYDSHSLLHVSEKQQMSSNSLGQKELFEYDSVFLRIDNVPKTSSCLPQYLNENFPTKYLNENHPTVIAARKNGMPISVGPSLTTARIMMLADLVEASTAEKKSAALSLFSFWVKKYFRCASVIHNYHFVMDMASNFGVPYEPFTYPKEITKKIPLVKGLKSEDVLHRRIPTLLKYGIFFTSMALSYKLANAGSDNDNKVSEIQPPKSI